MLIRKFSADKEVQSQLLPPTAAVYSRDPYGSSFYRTPIRWSCFPLIAHRLRSEREHARSSHARDLRRSYALLRRSSWRVRWRVALSILVLRVSARTTIATYRVLSVRHTHLQPDRRAYVARPWVAFWTLHRIVAHALYSLSGVYLKCCVSGFRHYQKKCLAFHSLKELTFPNHSTLQLDLTLMLKIFSRGRMPDLCT